MIGPRWEMRRSVTSLGCDKRFFKITGSMTTPLTPIDSFKLFCIRLAGFSGGPPKKYIWLRGVICYSLSEQITMYSYYGK